MSHILRLRIWSSFFKYEPPHLHLPHLFKVHSQQRLFRSWNMRLLSSFSRAITTSTTCRILLHSDDIDSSLWYSIFCANLVQLPKLWISSSPFGMSFLITRVPRRQRQRGHPTSYVSNMFCLIVLYWFHWHHFHPPVLVSFTCHLSRHPSLPLICSSSL